MIDVEAVITVFMFFFLMVVFAVASARLVVSWQNDRTQHQINRGIEEIRTRLGLRSAR